MPSTYVGQPGGRPSTGHSWPILHCDLLEDGLVLGKVKLDIGDEGLKLYTEARERDAEVNGSMARPSEWVEVTDSSGVKFEIAPGPCGTTCRCACFARRVAV